MASTRISPPPSGPYTGDKKQLIQDIHDALYASKICAYAQGMSLIRAGAKEYGWSINLSEMARIWTGGCIIRARLLTDIRRAFQLDGDLPNLLLDNEFNSRLAKAQAAWRRTVVMASNAGIAIPAFAASLAYFDSYRSAQLPQNLTQAQRDYFGSHTYQRTDDPNGKFTHTEWEDKA